MDLMLWWFGVPSSFSYEDDAMGGIEANSRLSVDLENGAAGEVRLSRDWQLPNRYTIRCERGWLNWNTGEAERLQIGFNDSSYVIDGKLFQASAPPGLLGNPGTNFHQSFVQQIRNVVAAMRGEDELRVPGATAIESVRLIEACYQKRKLMAMPWLSAREFERATELVQ